MKIVCDSCGTKYSIADDKVRGKVFKIRCKKCSHIIVVRGGETGGPEASSA
ncbi:MAG TPA: zinc-ribbon domain-containing protein, partial [Polyangia bacterium]